MSEKTIPQDLVDTNPADFDARARALRSETELSSSRISPWMQDVTRTAVHAEDQRMVDDYSEHPEEDHRQEVPPHERYNMGYDYSHFELAVLP